MFRVQDFNKYILRDRDRKAELGKIGKMERIKQGLLKHGSDSIWGNNVDYKRGE